MNKKPMPEQKPRNNKLKKINIEDLEDVRGSTEPAEKADRECKPNCKPV